MASAMKRRPPLAALHTFLVTAQYCNFTRAAAQLHVTQGAVSRQIAALEAHLGHALFERKARGLSLTAQGHALLPQMQQVFELIDAAVGRSEDASPTLRLKAPSCATRWLLPRLLRWQRERPDLPVELTTTVRHGADFNREAFDAAVVFGPRPGGDVQAHHLFDEQLIPVCAPQLIAGPVPLANPADLEQHMLLHPTADQRDWKQWLRVAGITLSNPRRGQHFETMDQAMTVAAQGVGVSIGDWSLIGDDLAQGRLITPFDLKVRTGAGYYLVYPPHPENPPLADLRDWLLEQARNV